LTVTSVYLSEITKVEFTSSVWKKVRTKEITELDAIKTLQLFERDSAKYTFLATDSIVIEQARILTIKYGLKGLRTLDSIQLSSAISLRAEVGLFVTSDILLKSLLSDEGLHTDMPI
jgi:predicted nucleic acid-binding protein